jgi:hypothetical protein
MSAEEFSEVVAAPYEVWVAPVGTAAPAIDAAPGVGWEELGQNGIDNQGSDGVALGFGETVTSFTPAGKTLPVKQWRTDESLSVAFSLVDMTVETLSKILDDAAITTVAAGAGVAGEKSISLVRGTQVKTFALLVRGLSPYDDGTGLQAQYEFGRVSQSGSQAPKYVKGTPAELACEFTVLGTVTGDDEAIYRAEDAPPTGP